MKKIISIILSVVLFITFLTFGLLLSIQQEFSFIDKVEALEYDINDLEKYSNMSKSDLHKTFDKELEKQNLPIELLDYIVDDENFTKTIDEFKEDYINYIKDNGEKPQIPTQKVNEIINNSIQRYNKDNNTNIKIDNEKIENLANDISDKVDDVVDKIESNNKITGMLKTIYNRSIQKVAFILSILIIVILIIINKQKSFIYIACPLLIAGITFLVGTIILRTIALSIIENLLGSTYDKMVKILLNLGIYTIIISIILIIINIVIKKKQKEV